MKVGILGRGYWGTILHDKLIGLGHDVVFWVGSTDTWQDKLKDVEWVFVATPNRTHENLVKQCLVSGVNVFCEKPFTMSYHTAVLMFKEAEDRGLKLYVDDVFNYRYETKQLRQLTNYPDYKDWTVVWKKYGRTDYRDFHKASIPNFMYHDLYLLYDKIKDSEVKWVDRFDIKSCLDFMVGFSGGITVNFHYDRSKECETTHTINPTNQSYIDYAKSTEDVLPTMLEMVLNETVDFDYNKEITLFVEKTMGKIRRQLFPKVMVVGAGIFGATVAWKLSKVGYEVDLFDKQETHFKGATLVNQYRLHKGYHYPRSKETAISCLRGEQSFKETYGECIQDGDDHYYCISKKDSFITVEEYLDFLDDVGLDYEVVDELDIINGEEVDLIVKVNESLFNPHKLKTMVHDKLLRYDVNLHFNTDVDERHFEAVKYSYDHVVISTYTNNNQFLETEDQEDYQFEVCEKPVVMLPPEYKGKSVVIMDGPFMCIDPLGMQGMHVMGNVVHAIHETNVGKFPEVSDTLKKQLDSIVVERPTVSNVDKFTESSMRFFNGIEEGSLAFSMFTVRTVLPKREHDDARPSIIKKHGNVYTIFSGKIDTCVDIANELVEKLDEQTSDLYGVLRAG